MEADPERRLAVYGSLAPGGRHHDQIAGLAGTWTAGLFVRGELSRGTAGSARGYPALRWHAAGALVAVQLFESADLPSHWARLDAFEGDGYRRLVVPLFAAHGTEVGRAQVYAAR